MTTDLQPLIETITALLEKGGGHKAHFEVKQAPDGAITTIFGEEKVAKIGDWAQLGVSTSDGLGVCFIIDDIRRYDNGETWYHMAGYGPDYFYKKEQVRRIEKPDYFARTMKLNVEDWTKYWHEHSFNDYIKLDNSHYAREGQYLGMKSFDTIALDGKQFKNHWFTYEIKPCYGPISKELLAYA